MGRSYTGLDGKPKEALGTFEVGPDGSAVNAGAGYAGITGSASFLPVAEAYSAGDIIAAATEIEFTFANGQPVPNGSLIRITTAIMKIDAAAVISGETSYTLHAYSVTPPSAQLNNAAWTLASADLPSYRGSIALGTPLDLGAALYVKSPNIDLDIKLAGDSIFAELVTVGAFTAAAVARQVLLYGFVI